ncbi:MAG: carbamoyl-phosphate synthase large subunit, partial [Neisseriaceae bacterium]|nr:carbamoyl-phosphate synthase large subunit [Neisseriaceae bacterium]
NGEMIIIEMNPRVSRSSALASKATGFPIAKIAAKLAVGYTLDELKNDITGGRTPASFEPSIDYVVTKIPRFAFEKFPAADDRLTTQMKSVGEVMAIGRTFQESMQKALRGLETGLSGLDNRSTDLEEIKSEISDPGAERLLFVADAMRLGLSVEELYKQTGIDPWFLANIEDLINEEKQIVSGSLKDLYFNRLRTLKRKGFSDKRIAKLLNISEKEVRNHRYALNLHPVYKRVDTCAAEFATDTAYLYSSYEEECEAAPTNRKKVMILGGGPNRIGQGIEFDYCCVHAALSLRESGWETIMVNCNPETVSTDYDTSDRLYFEPLTLEDVLEIVRTESPNGVIVHYGGQTPLKLANDLVENGVKIIGTSADAIDAAEDRERFQQILKDLGLRQPENRTATNEQDALRLAEEVGYPLVVRPSYVLGGRAMQIVHSADELQTYMREAVKVSNDSPVLLDHYLDNAIEVDVDCVCDGEQAVIGGIMQHIEQAGVHSGDSACSIPAYSLSGSIQDEIRRQTKAMAFALNVVGLMNVQFAVKDDVVYVLEVNPRASRTVPFVSKATGVPLAKIAARVMAGESLKSQGFEKEVIPEYFAVKEAVFPFIKFPGVDTILGPEMRSTGEVMGVGKTFSEAYLKAQLGAGEKIPHTGKIFLSVRNEDKGSLKAIASEFLSAGYSLCATEGTAAFLQNAGLACEKINKVREGRPHIVDALKNGEIAMAVNTVNNDAKSIKDSHAIRRNALNGRIPLYTTTAGGAAVAEAVKSLDKTNVYSVQELHGVK